MPIRLTARQQAYARRAVGISRFVYNLCVATHAFCRINRLPWPSWQDLNHAVNETKQHDFPFLKEVSYRVIDGAVRDFGHAVANWRNPDIRARKPAFKKKRLTGSGSFRAAGAVREIKYDGKRRVRLPYLGSVKLAHTLPKGVIHEARISFHNGQWLLSINYWKPPATELEPGTRIEKGGVDTGINPHATDSEGQTWENPKAYYVAERKLAAGNAHKLDAPSTRRAGGSPATHRPPVPPHQRLTSPSHPPDDQRTRPQVSEPRHRGPPRCRIDAGQDPQGQADASMGEIKRQLLYKGQRHHCEITLAPPFYPSSKTCSHCGFVHAKLKRERFWQCRPAPSSTNATSTQPPTCGPSLTNCWFPWPPAGYAPRRAGSGPPAQPTVKPARTTGELHRSHREQRRL